MITRPQIKSNRFPKTSNSSASTATVYTARDFSGYTLQHLKAMYPHSWQEAALHFGINSAISIESEVSQIKQTAIEQQVWDFYPTPKSAIAKMLKVAQLDPNHSVLEPTNSVRPTLPLATAKPSRACGFWRSHFGDR